MKNNQHNHGSLLTRNDDQANINFDEFVQEYNTAKEKVDSLQRCTRCVLPETFPFITFDEDGVCNFCHNYHKKEPLGMDALEEFLD